MIVDDGILDHRKFIRATRSAGSAAVHLWLGLMTYCRQQRTDGRVPLDIVPHVNGPVQRWRARALEALIDAELVERVGGELLMHNYLHWSDSREEIERKSADRKAAIRARRERLAMQARPSSDDAPTTDRQPSEDAPMTDRRQPVSNDNAKLAGENQPSYPNGSDPIRSDPDPPVSPPPEPSQAAPAKGSTSSPRSGKAPKARASICPDDLKPDTTTANTAWELGFSDPQVAEELAGMKDWSRSKSARRDDWQATLRNWLRKSARERGLSPRKPKDARYQAHQEAVRKANAPPTEPVKLPKHIGGSLFG